MKVLIYNIDKGGLKSYSEYLVNSLIKQKKDVTLSDKIDYNNCDIVHIQFEHAVFHPFGLRLIPVLAKLKIRKKKIVITNHTILAKKEIYARNKLFLFIKKILFPLDEILMGFLSDKIIVHTSHAKKILIDDYKIPDKKIEVIPHGVYLN
jgi:glycosyltransferase involved in cell wall biosynthesis